MRPIETGRSSTKSGAKRRLASTRLFECRRACPRLTSARRRATGRRREAGGALGCIVSAIKMFAVSRHARQYSSRFSVVALLARLWRPF